MHDGVGLDTVVGADSFEACNAATFFLVRPAQLRWRSRVRAVWDPRRPHSLDTQPRLLATQAGEIMGMAWTWSSMIDLGSKLSAWRIQAKRVARKRSSAC